MLPIYSILLSFFLLSLMGCQSAVQKAVQETKYSAYEVFGVQKRDLLKKEVKAVREEQKETQDEFKEALERIKALTQFSGGKLEREYRRINASYEDARDQAEVLRGRIRQVDVIAQDLFKEWAGEIDQIETPNLKAESRRSLGRTQKRYQEMYAQLKKSEGRMDPVLSRLKDQVLYLKHNLNAQAVGSLKGESLSIQKDIERLLQEMKTSIEAADQFIRESEV